MIVRFVDIGGIVDHQLFALSAHTYVSILRQHVKHKQHYNCLVLGPQTLGTVILIT